MIASRNGPTRLAGLSARERKLLGEISASEQPTITADDVVDRLGLARPQANVVLSRLFQKGWLQRLKRGVYAPVPIHSTTDDPVASNPLAIATALFAPGYITGWSAAEHWDLTEQVSNTVVVFTAQRLRSTTHLIGRVKFRTKHVSEEKIFGTHKVWSGSAPILMADPHRTVIDVLGSPAIGGGGRQTLDIVASYWAGRHANPDRLIEYAERVGNGALFKRLGFTAELFTSPPEEWIDRCRNGMSEGVALLDPAGPRRGSILSRWRIRINIPMPREE
jgi:predicted transcriptional regulator of viral defense system